MNVYEKAGIASGNIYIYILKYELFLPQIASKLFHVNDISN